MKSPSWSSVLMYFMLCCFFVTCMFFFIMENNIVMAFVFCFIAGGCGAISLQKAKNKTMEFKDKQVDDHYKGNFGEKGYDFFNGKK